MKRIQQVFINRLKSCPPEGEGGFTLIELLIALTIFAIGILAVASMQTSAMRAGAHSSGLTQAVLGVNQDRIEYLLSLPYDHSDLDGSAGGTTHPPVASIKDGVTYSTQWTVTTDAPSDDCKTVVVQTSWTDLGGSHSVRTSFVTDSIL